MYNSAYLWCAAIDKLRDVIKLKMSHTCRMIWKFNKIKKKTEEKEKKRKKKCVGSFHLRDFDELFSAFSGDEAETSVKLIKSKLKSRNYLILA